MVYLGVVISTVILEEANLTRVDSKTRERHPPGFGLILICSVAFRHPSRHSGARPKHSLTNILLELWTGTREPKTARGLGNEET